MQLNKKQAAAMLFDLVKKDVEDKGGSLTVKGFPKKYPVSLRTVRYLKAGELSERTIKILKFLADVEVAFKIKTK